MTETQLNTANPAFGDMITYWDFEHPAESQDPADIVPWLPNDPVVKWCRENLRHPVQIFVGLREDWQSRVPYHESFTLRAVFWTPQEAVLFKLTWG